MALLSSVAWSDGPAYLALLLVVLLALLLYPHRKDTP
jgi:hypothetical protein